MAFVSERAQNPVRQLIATAPGRYEIEASIAKGGMGEVYRAIDTVTGQRVALKRLLDGGDHPVLHALFKLEYETLSRLRHPHIIEVFDFGVDQLGPYYTMELLDGRDLQSLGPVEYREACAYLRDVAASLALLHTRRIVHRDLSPKNVRLTSDGRCKLIDFGAMAFVGLPSDPVGTPPMLAPEALTDAPLDHRVDLYALGALSYWVLTGRHAYPVARIHELKEAWKKAPPPPSAIDPRIPPRLDELVMSLLKLDENGRPPSAAYVIEILTAIGNLPPERSLDDARSYVAIPALVGRERELQRGKELLSSLEGGQGGRLLIESNPGVGRTRLLEELSLAARLSGLLVVDVDAGEHRGQLDLARALLRNLLDVGGAPVETQVARHESDLLPLLPERVRTGTPSRPPAALADSRKLLSESLCKVVRGVAKVRPLAVMIDDVHWADEHSLSLLCDVIRSCDDVPLLLIATEEVAAVLAAGGALERFNRRVGGSEESQDGASTKGRVRLHAMRSQDTYKLVRGIFGDVPNSQRLARWMHAVSLGNVGQNIALASHLVERGHLRYLDGTWVLAENIPNDELPSDLRNALRKRVEQLSREARDLSESLSLLRGAFSLEQCAALHGGGASAVMATMEELTGLGIVVKVEESYLFARELFRDLLLRDVNPRRIEDLHGRIAEMLALTLPQRIAETGASTLAELMKLSLHELLGGREAQGLSRFMQLVDLPMRSQPEPKLAVDLAAAARSAALTCKASAAVRLRAQAYQIEACVWAGSDVPDGLSEATVAQLSRQAGVGMAMRLHPWLGTRLAVLGASMACGLLRILSPRSRRGLPPPVARRLLARTAVAAAVAHVIEGKRSPLRRLLLSVEIFARLPAASFGAVAYRALRSLERFVSGRFVDAAHDAEQVMSLAAESHQSDGAERDARDLMPVALFVIAACLSRAGNRRALDVCKDLRKHEQHPDELLPLSLALCAVFHRLRGEAALASPFERKREMLLSDRASGSDSRNLLLMAVRTSSAAMVGDLLALKEGQEACVPITRGDPEVESLGEAARVAYLIHSGHSAEALASAERLLPQVGPWSSAHWLEARAVCASALLCAGRERDAVQLVTETLKAADKRVEATDFARATLVLLMVDAEIALGRSEAAAIRLDALSRTLANQGSPVLMGRVHERLAHLANQRGDHEEFVGQVGLVRRYFASSGDPVLSAQAERLGDTLSGRPTRSLAAPPIDVNTAMQYGRRQRHPLSGCESPSGRAEETLRTLQEAAASIGGLLYLVQAEGLRLSARAGEVPAGRDYDQFAREAVDARLEKHSGSTATSQRLPTSTGAAEVPARVVHVLACLREGRLFAVGAVVLLGDRDALRAPGRRVLSALAEALLEAGDVCVGPDFQA